MARKTTQMTNKRKHRRHQKKNEAKKDAKKAKKCVPSDATIAEEFQVLQSFAPPALLDDPVHLDKCRYLNIHPTIEHRVILSSGEFINADHYKNMILCQAPTPATYAAFWQMVVEHGVSTIVMLTQLHERGVHKADRYWPHDGLQEHETSAYTRREFAVNADRRIVAQYHLKNWGDHGVPDVDDIKALLENVGGGGGGGPLVIHCSAGIGRSGTLAAIIECMNSGRPPFEVVKEMRQHRNGAVQTSEQYAFIHKFIASK